MNLKNRTIKTEGRLIKGIVAVSITDRVWHSIWHMVRNPVITVVFDQTEGLVIDKLKTYGFNE